MRRDKTKTLPSVVVITDFARPTHTAWGFSCPLFSIPRLEDLTDLPHAEATAGSRTHSAQSAGELGVLLLDLELCAGSLCVAEGVYDLAFCPRELGGALEVLEGVGDLALLKEELGHCGDGDVAFGVDDEGLLAQLLGLVEVVLPLEQGEGLVDQRKHVHAEGLAALLHLDGGVELLDSFLVLLLVEEQFAVVVVDVGDLREVLHAAAEGGHGGGDGSHLVLCNAELDVREDEGLVEVDGALVVLCGLTKLGLDEVQLCAVVVDVGVLLVLGEGCREVGFGGLRVGCGGSVMHSCKMF